MFRPVAVALVAAALLTPALAASAKRTPPVGSYQATCRQIALSNDGILSAQCQTGQGGYVLATLNIAICGQGDIGASNGRLTCPPIYGRIADVRTGTGQAKKKGGYGPASIILYDGVNFQGRSLELRGDIDRLDYERFNDVASSVRLKGGEWQICQDAVYRGKCVVTRRDMPDLGQHGLNDQLSSLRRIG